MIEIKTFPEDKFKKVKKHLEAILKLFYEYVDELKQKGLVDDPDTYRILHELILNLINNITKTYLKSYFEAFEKLSKEIENEKGNENVAF